MLRATLLSLCATTAVALPAQTFDAPTPIKAGDEFVGEKLDDRDRLYPSPAIHDIDGDGNLEMVIGDLRGYLTVTEHTKEGWGKEEKLLATDGEPLKFRNW